MWLIRYKPAENIVFFNREKKTIFLDQKGQEIKLEDIERIDLWFRDHDIARPEPHGKIRIRTKDGKKYKQKHLANIFWTVEKIVYEMEQLGLESPKIYDKTGLAFVETKDNKQFYRRHVMTGIWNPQNNPHEVREKCYTFSPTLGIGENVEYVSLYIEEQFLNTIDSDTTP